MKIIAGILFFTTCSLLIINLPVQTANFTVNNVTQFQAALNTAAANGQSDTINVMGGIYNVNPVLTFSSNENYFILIRGSGSPVLDGANLRQILQLTSTANNGDIFLEGLTIQHGRADYGGGLNILTQGADINLSNCNINNNTALFVAGGANLFSNTGNITVTNSSFRMNSSPNTTGYPYGTAGGLFIQTDGAGTTIRVTGCTFEFNTAQRDAAGAMLYPLGPGSTVIAESNTFNSNTAKEFGGGCWIRGPGGNITVRYSNNILNGNSSSTAGSGGGTYIQITSGSIDLYDNVHTGNNATWQGGGLWIEHGGGLLNVHRNRFTNNISIQDGGGANVFIENGTANVHHNVFNRNRTSGNGGGLNLSTTSGRVNIFNNTFYLNAASDGGDVNLYFDNSSAVCDFFNNILYKSSLPALSYSGQQTVVARYSDIQGGIGQPWFGTGCIDLYPFFADTSGGNFHLQDSIHCSNQRYSPCIDAGSPGLRDSLQGCSWGLGQIRSDIGMYGGKDSVVIGIKKLYTIVPEGYVLYQNYPNPFNPITKIKFAVPKTPLSPPFSQRGDVRRTGGFITLKVFDILGREIQTLVNEQLSPGTYEVEFDGTNYSSGVYYYTLSFRQAGSSTGDFVETKKMLLIK